MKAKKVLSGALAAILLTLTPGVAVCAEEMAGQEQTENTQVLSAQEQENQEKAASYAEKIDTNEISNWPQGPAIYAASGIVMDMNSGAVLYAKKPKKKISCEYYESVECFDCITVCENVRYRCVFRGQYFFFAVG
ncbi:MAG: hypothetical protein ACLUJR_10105 [Mediterraneibacter gnavus]